MKDYGFITKNKDTLKGLEACMDILLPMSKVVDYRDNIWIALENKPYRALILPDDYKEYIRGYGYLLSKDFSKYKNLTYTWIGLQKNFDEYIESERKKKERYEPTRWGVYGIYRNGELIYIGSTKNFKKRFQEHRDYIANGKGDLYVYSLIRPGDRIEFKELVVGNRL